MPGTGTPLLAEIQVPTEIQVPGTGYPSPCARRPMQSPLPPLLVLRGALFGHLLSAPKGFLSTRGFPGESVEKGGGRAGGLFVSVRRGSLGGGPARPGPVCGWVGGGVPLSF